MPHSDLHKEKLKKNIAVIGLVLGICALIFAITMVKLTRNANAAEGKIVTCGTPAPADLETDPGIDVCDIYTRQLAYKAERDAFHEQMKERQENFAAPSIEAYQNYRESLDKMYYPDEDAQSDEAVEDEIGNEWNPEDLADISFEDAQSLTQLDSTSK